MTVSYASGGGRYHPIFFMPDKAVWEALQGRIWDEYYKQADQYFRKRMDIKVDEIIIAKEDLPP